MTIPFAIRPRIRLDAAPVRTRSASVPPSTVPVLAYWVGMGLLTYGVARGAIRPQDWTRARAPAGAEVPGARAVPVRRAPVAPLEAVPPPAPVAPPPAPVARRAPEPAVEPSPRALGTVRSFSLGWEEPPSLQANAGVTALPAPEPAPPPVPRDPPLPPRDEAIASSRSRANAMLAARSRNDATSPLRQDEPSPWRPAPRGATDDPRPGRRAASAVAMNLADDPLGLPGSFDDVPRARPPGAAPRGDATGGPPARDEPATPPAPSRAAVPATASPRSCEAVAAAANDEIDMTAGRGAPDVTRDAYAGVLERGSYLAPCAVPASTSLDVCAAVLHGRAVGVTVVARPPDPRITSCVRGVVSRLAFPSSERLDVTRTHFDAVRRR